MTLNTDYETEIKLPIADLAEAQAKVVSLGARILQNRHFEDNFAFDTDDLALRKQARLLRIRIVGSQGILTFKGTPDTSRGVKEREEIQCETSDPQNLIKILQKLGYTIFFRYQKFRTIYKIDLVPLEICIDETPIGNYFELEGEIDRIHEFAHRLGFTREQYITESYATLYLRWCRQNQKEAGDMIFP